MSRYIDADKLKQHYSWWDRTGDYEAYKAKKLFDDIIDLQPTADVVEVVRCNDCKYGEVDNADFPNQYLCHHHGSAWNEGNHFCSYGERADE